MSSSESQNSPTGQPAVKAASQPEVKKAEVPKAEVAKAEVKKTEAEVVVQPEAKTGSAGRAASVPVARSGGAQKKPAPAKQKTPVVKLGATESNGSTGNEKLVGRTLRQSVELTEKELSQINTKKGLLQLLSRKHIDVNKALATLRYERELERLQIELVKLQRSVQLNGRRVGILIEGRDAAGKGGTIRRFIEHLNPRSARVVALPKPTEVQKGQWYFQRYVEQLPNPGEIVFFDRSWYNRAVVEPVMDFCTDAQYKTFMQQVPEFEHMLYEDNIEIVKFWFSISKDVQEDRFQSRRVNPLKQWKISPVDEEAQKHWDRYTRYKEDMFSRTHTSYSPWIIVKSNNKKEARLESIRYVLSTLDYEGKEDPCTNLSPDPDVVLRYHRSSQSID